MKRIYFLYGFITIAITLIFILYYQNQFLDAKVRHQEEALVFYDENNQIKGTYLEVTNPIKDIFSYLTDKRNNLPLEAKCHSNSNLVLEDYKEEGSVLFLEVSSSDKTSLDNFIPLLYESYYVLGYKILKISINNEESIYDSADIFSIADYSSYKVLNVNGKIRRSYQFDDNEIILNVLLIAEVNIEEILNDIDGISYHIEDSVVSVEIIDTNNKDIILKLLELNLKDIGYSFQAL